MSSVQYTFWHPQQHGPLSTNISCRLASKTRMWGFQAEVLQTKVLNSHHLHYILTKATNSITQYDHHGHIKKWPRYFCLVDKFNHHYLLNLEKRFWNIHLSFLTFKIILTETKGPSIASIYPRSLFSETLFTRLHTQWFPENILKLHSGLSDAISVFKRESCESAYCCLA